MRADLDGKRYFQTINNKKLYYVIINWNRFYYTDKFTYFACIELSRSWEFFQFIFHIFLHNILFHIHLDLMEFYNFWNIPKAYRNCYIYFTSAIYITLIHFSISLIGFALNLLFFEDTNILDALFLFWRCPMLKWVAENEVFCSKFGNFWRYWEVL